MTTFTYQERFKTAQGVFDEFTNRTLFELESRNHFEEMVSPLKVGKESNVFLAQKGKKKVIVKIYRVQTCDFKRMFEYIRQDPRFQYLQQHRRAIILAWVQREYKNLMKAYHAGVRVPKPLAVMNNILVEEMIGDDEPALPLKDTHPENPGEFLDLIIADMKKMYKKGLIHGDLSSFNILNWNEVPYFIDFSQSTMIKAPNSHELLVRDVKNVCQFFRKLGVKVDAEDILKEITGS